MNRDEHQDQVVNLLLTKGANKEAVDSLGYTPLDYACKYRHLDAATKLIQQK